jgi:hypothetical protein
VPTFKFKTDVVVHNHTEADEWLVVRAVTVGTHQPNSVSSRFVMGKARTDGSRSISRFRSQERLNAAICQAKKGWPAHGTKYVEVLPWREDGRYPTPIARV